MAKIILRATSAIMFVVAIVFFGYAFSHPVNASVFYVGKFEIGPTIWRLFYAIYFLLMISLFVSSFLIKNKNKKKKLKIYKRGNNND